MIMIMIMIMPRDISRRPSILWLKRLKWRKKLWNIPLPTFSARRLLQALHINLTTRLLRLRVPAILQVQPLVISRSVAAISSQRQNGTRVQTFQSKVSTWMPAAEFQKSTMSLSLVVEPILIKRQVPSLQPVTVRQTTINSRERSAAMRPV